MLEYATMTELREKLYRIIFEVDTPAGRAFDVLLIAAVVVSIVCVSLESVSAIRADYGRALIAAEWLFTLLFTAEYIVRLAVTRRPLRYAFSFFGAVDFLAILPTYMSLLFPGAQMLMAIRALRLLRVFRILKLARYTTATQLILAALRESRHQVVVFLWGVVSLVIIVGSVMYLVEGAENGFTSIPRSIYWAVVTMTTVGYGDIVPRTNLGQFISMMLMISGYGLIAVPTGIVTVEMSTLTRRQEFSRRCGSCGKEDHQPSARFCDGCGGSLDRGPAPAAPEGR